jgi:hypothetical protein
MIFCDLHRLPENHECSFDLTPKSLNGTDLRNTLILYQDALEFVEKETTVADICQYLSTKRLNEQESIDLLSFIFESSDDFETRVHAIHAFEILKLNLNQTFLILENAILSDKNGNVREAAASVISKMFPKRSKNLLELYRQNQKSH